MGDGNFDLTGYGHITSVVASRGGDIVHEQYAEGDAGSLRNTRSCTKTVLGMIVGAAIAREMLPGVDSTLADLLGSAGSSVYPDPRKPAITVRELLTMSSCLECDDSNPYSAGNEERMYPREDWVQFALDLPIRRDREFSYCTAGVVTLGVGVSRTLGEPLSAFAGRELFPAAGIAEFEWPTTPLGDDSAAGGLCLSTRSLLGLVELYLDGGREAVPAAWVEESTTAHQTVDDDTGYGYLWWLKSYEGHHSYAMAGAGGNRVHAFPDLDLAVAVTTRNFGVAGAHAITEKLLVDQVLPRLA